MSVRAIDYIKTDYGTVYIKERNLLYMELIKNMIQVIAEGPEMPSIAFPGGSTPKSFYEWCNKFGYLDKVPLNKVIFTTSDERCVPFSDPESNFGTLDRMFLRALRVPAENKVSWQTREKPEVAAANMNALWAQKFGTDMAFDLCMLGMGDDAHIASIFPFSSVFKTKPKEFFTHLPESGKQHRLTITPEGLLHCKQIIVLVTGITKYEALQSVFLKKYNPRLYPGQLLKTVAERALWLMDNDAAGDIFD